VNLRNSLLVGTLVFGERFNARAELFATAEFELVEGIHELGAAVVQLADQRVDAFFRGP
jgi:hypothetical protein